MSLATGLVVAMLGRPANPGATSPFPDASGNANGWDLVGPPAWVDTASYSSGAYGWGVRFTANAQRLRAATTPSANCTIARPLTLFLRYYCEGGDSSDTRVLVAPQDCGFADNTGARKDSANVFHLTDGTNYIDGSGTTGTGAWHSWAFTSDTDTGKTCILYKNGAADVTTVNGGTGNSGTFFSTPYNFGQVGKDQPFFTWHPHGVVVDICLWSRVLSALEIGIISTDPTALPADIANPAKNFPQLLGLASRFWQEPAFRQGLALGDRWSPSPYVLEQLLLGQHFVPLDQGGALSGGLALGDHWSPSLAALGLTGGLSLGGSYAAEPSVHQVLNLDGHWTATEPRGSLVQKLRLSERFFATGPAIARGRYRR